MSLYAFGQGFSQGVDTGTQLYDTYAKGRNRRGMEQAQEILAEMQHMGPDVHVQTGALPENGEVEGVQGLPVGFDGTSWNAKKAEYLKALSRVTDPRSMIAMEDRLAMMEKEKVMGHGRMAMAALENGDLETAQRHMAGISYYTDPEGTSSVNITPDGNIIFDEGDGPAVLTKDNLQQYLEQFNDFGGWAQLAFSRDKFDKEVDLRNRALAAEIENNAARLAATTARYAVQNDYDRARIAKAEREAQAAALLAQTDKEEKERERFSTDLDKALTKFNEPWAETTALPSTGKDKSTGAELIGEESAIPETDTQIYQEAARENTSISNVKGTALRNIYESKPLNPMIATTLMAGLIEGGDFSSPEEIGEFVRAFIVEPDDSNFFSYDPENGIFTVGGNQHFRVGEQQANALRGLFGSAPQPQTALPETGATP